ncbi:MAG: hypothetical protein IID30_03160 [Planctomycetes bacterium]|nr:hypothetical protein [Planctomycetota bacterium]
MAPVAIAVVTGLAIALGVLVIIFVLVPVLKGIGWLIGSVFKGIGWFVVHIFEFISGMIGDVLRFVGAIFAIIALIPLTMLNVVIGRWSAAGHFAESVKRECSIGITCLYRLALQRPLRLVLLHGLLEGIEQRVPEAMAGAPTADKPRRSTGQFDGYTIVGSLRGGGSGGKLYVAEPDEKNRQRGMPDRVVIKSFALTEGSSLPQIVRESRSLEAAKQLGLVLDHGMEEHRFFYVMPFHDGEHLGVVTRQLHGESDGRGLGTKQLANVMKYSGDLLQTLSTYHKGGLWHKDIKPENVIIHDGRAHIVDFGLVTPLRSAMTLTTHGTEYFRDPEMVRQALRGVKVHQVDGAKFDIYAVGAVLYFVLENTFPAHGGLSRFQMKSPESLRWIVKRSMADYNQRYETADEMLADLVVVMNADDPYQVKPVQLPSMQGEAVPLPMEEAPDQVAQVNQAGSPQPKFQPAVEPVVAAAAAGGAAVVGGMQPGLSPKLRVTSWWTGAYTVDDPGSVGNAGYANQENAEYAAFREEARSFRREAAEIRSKVRNHAMSARRAAREQIKAARARAKDIRHRARARRHGYAANPKPAPFLAFLVMVVLVGGGIIGATLVMEAERQSPISISIPGLPELPRMPQLSGLSGSLPPVLLVTNVPDLDRLDIRAQIDAYIQEVENNYNVVIENVERELAYRDLMIQWYENQDGPADGKLEELMKLDDLYGIMYVASTSNGKIVNEIIKSTAPGASKRRRAASHAPRYSEHSAWSENSFLSQHSISHASTDLPILLINDHPAKADPRVEEQVQAYLKAYRDRGWNIEIMDEAEVKIRQALPIGPITPESKISEKFYALLADLKLGGVLTFSAASGDGDLHERISNALILSRDLANIEASHEEDESEEDDWDC